jgi:hypothetical protein
VHVNITRIRFIADQTGAFGDAKTLHGTKNVDSAGAKWRNRAQRCLRTTLGGNLYNPMFMLSS